MKLQPAVAKYTTVVACRSRRSIAKIVGASLAALSLTCAHAAPATAGSTSGSISVVGSVVSSCTIGSGTLRFGTSTPGAAVTGSTAISADCTLLTPATISIDTGLNYANALSGSTRAVKYGSSYFSYDLYQDTADSVPWSATGPGLLTFVGTGSAKTVKVYGKIPASQTSVSAGNGTYSDTVTVTINY